MSRELDLLALLDLVVAVELGPRPNPTPRPWLIRHEDVDAHRSFSCSEYGACLEVAFRNDWPSWSCRRCALFARRAAERRAGHSGAALPDA